MTLVEKIKSIYPELTNKDFDFGTIVLQNDGNGDYIKSWNHPTLTRPTQTQLDGVTE
jgi:hypothetical protein